jgi:hypothetical protein
MRGVGVQVVTPGVQVVTPGVQVVIPSFAGHVVYLRENLESWLRFCSDVGLVKRFNVVLTGDREGERALFHQTLEHLVQPLNVRFLELREAMALASERMSDERLHKLVGKHADPDARPPWPGALPVRKISPHFKHVLQSAKKLYGCLAAARDGAGWCFVTDSETLLLRCVALTRLVDDYAGSDGAGRAILFNPRYNPPTTLPESAWARRVAFQQFGMFQCPRRCDALLLGVDDPGLGWVMESYHWLWDTELLTLFHRLLLSRNSTPAQLWERGAFGDALQPNETGREPFVRGGRFPDGVACRTKLMIEQTYAKFIRALQHAETPRGGAPATMAGGGHRPPSEVFGARMAAPELRRARECARRYTFVSTADLATRLGLPYSVATANVDDGFCSFGECMSALLPRMSEGQAMAAAAFLRRHRISTLTPRAERNASCRYCPPPRRPLSAIEAKFLEASRVSFLTGGGLHDGPFAQHARSINGLPRGHTRARIAGKRRRAGRAAAGAAAVAGGSAASSRGHRRELVHVDAPGAISPVCGTASSS